MTFNAKAITATIGLDENPALKALARVAAGAGGLKQTFERAMGGLGASLKAGLGHVLEGIGQGIGQKITEVVPALIEKLKDSMEHIDEAGKAAASLGITTQAFTELGYAARLAGSSQEELSSALRKMQNNLSDAANGIGPAADSLKAMGLSAEALANLAPEVAFGKLADGLNGIQNASQRTGAALNIFGLQAGPHLLALLSAGSKGLQEQAQGARDLQITFNDIDSAKVQQANDALTRAGLLITGAVQTAVIALAPYIEGLADRFVDAGIASGGFGKTAVGAVEGIALAIAKVTDLLSLFKSAFYVIETLVLGVTAAIIKMAELTLEVSAKIWSFVPAMKGAVAAMRDAASDLQGMYENVGIDAATAWEKATKAANDFADGTHSAKVLAVFDEIKKKSEETAKNTAANLGKMQGGGFSSNGAVNVLADLQKQLDQTGLNEFQKQFDDIRRKGQLNSGDLGQAKDIIGRLEALSVMETIMTPGEKFRKAMDQLERLHNDHAITDEAFNAASKKAQTDAFGATKLPGLIRAGSAEAQAAKYDGGQKNDTPTLLKGLQQLQRDANASLKKMADVLYGQAVAGVTA